LEIDFPFNPNWILSIFPSYNCPNSAGPYTGVSCCLPNLSEGTSFAGELIVDGSAWSLPT
jgi:hypothetical protein